MTAAEAGLVLVLVLMLMQVLLPMLIRLENSR